MIEFLPAVDVLTAAELDTAGALLSRKADQAGKRRRGKSLFHLGKKRKIRE
jgi:hypothetical protein